MRHTITRQKNGKFRLRYTLDQGKTWNSGGVFDKQADAKSTWTEIQVKFSQGEITADQRKARTKLRTYATDAYLPSLKGHGFEHRRRSRQNFEDYINPYLGDVALRDLDDSMVRSWALRMVWNPELDDLDESEDDLILGTKSGAPLSLSSAHHIYNTLTGCLRLAKKDKLISVLPFDREECPIPAIVPVRASRWLTPHEVYRLADCARDSGGTALIWLLAYGGFRIGEALALTVGDLSEDGTVSVTKTMKDNGGKVAIKPMPKNAGSIRTVPLNTRVLDIIADYVDAEIGWGDPTAQLFRARRGGFLRPNNWRREWFDPAVQAAGLTPLTPHHLRHTAASIWLDQKELSVYAVAKLLGHKSTTMVERVYGHMIRVRNEKALEGLDRVFDEAKVEPASNITRLRRWRQEAG